MALGGRVGVGNIAGVATAIHFGGPGAMFWMWATAIVGSAVAVAECSLAQVWKEEVNGEYRGGPAYYIEKGIGWKWLAVLYAVAALFAFSVTGPSIQSFNIAESANTAWGVDPASPGRWSPCCSSRWCSAASSASVPCAASSCRSWRPPTSCSVWSSSR